MIEDSAILDRRFMHNRPDYRNLRIGDQESAPTRTKLGPGTENIMIRQMSMVIFATSLLGMSPAVDAQDCSNWNSMTLAGTYTMSGGGSIDLSKALPGVPGMPAGLVPVYWVGATVFDGFGGATGWVALNAAGNQMSGTFVNKKYSIKPDCSVQVTYSLKINEMQGLVVGPFSHLMVPVVKNDRPWWDATALELHMMTVGTAPGTAPAPLLDSGVMYRIAMQP